MLGGWERSGIATFASGFPVTITQSGDRAGVGGGTQRPERGRHGDYPRNRERVLQYDGVRPGAARAHSATRASTMVRGPGISNDFTMNFYRNFTFHAFGQGRREAAHRRGDLQYLQPREFLGGRGRLRHGDIRERYGGAGSAGDSVQRPAEFLGPNVLQGDL